LRSGKTFSTSTTHHPLCVEVHNQGIQFPVHGRANRLEIFVLNYSRRWRIVVIGNDILRGRANNLDDFSRNDQAKLDDLIVANIGEFLP
jgi:hypothetical protein